MNKELQVMENFLWQDGFGVLSFAELDLQSVLHYIQHQKEHHGANKLNEAMEKVEEEDA